MRATGIHLHLYQIIPLMGMILPGSILLLKDVVSSA
jgi:hypothetical protein